MTCATVERAIQSREGAGLIGEGERGLPEFVADYASCTANIQSNANSALPSAVKEFEKATAAIARDQEPECDEWIRHATDAWTAVHRTAKRPAKIGRTQ